MTTERPTYHGQAYVTSRPTYPSRIYEIIQAYHSAGGGGSQHALDLGCGPGFLALELSKQYKNVTGLDPEEGMVTAGLQPEDLSKDRIKYGVGTAENLRAAGISDQSVDLVVAGEAAHYFNHARSWPELARVLKPSGTVAWIGYGRISFPGHEAANTIVGNLMDSDLGPYWSEPGWSISEGLYDQIPFPVTPAATEELVSSLPDLSGTGHPTNSTIYEPEPTGCGEWDPASCLRLKSGTTAGQWYLREHWSLAKLEKCLRSWSSVKRYQDKNPDDKEKGPEDDLVGRTVSQLRPILGEKLDIAWPLVIMFARRK